MSTRSLITRSARSDFSHCHCSQCRRLHGAAFASFAGVPRSATCMSQYNSAQSAELAAIVLGVGAGVFVALGLGLVIADAGTSSERAQLTCTPGLGGVACGGQF